MIAVFFFLIQIITVGECINIESPFSCFNYISSSGLRQVTILKRTDSMPFKLTIGYNIIDRSSLGALDLVSDESVIALFTSNKSAPLVPVLSIEAISKTDIGDMFINLNENSNVANVYRLNKNKLFRFHARIIFATGDATWVWLHKSFAYAGNLSIIAYVPLDEANSNSSQTSLIKITIIDTDNEKSTQTETSLIR
jgi:hypothetical protein